ncbi:MAG: DUF6088 family protein [Oligoflexia bacterium]|nr:DUF6088 family protein [Oligoflexia bacterium]
MTMNTAQTVRNKITDQGPDSLWSYADFGGVPFQALAKALSRLVKDGLIQRVRKGIYYYPKKTALGASQPSASALLAKAMVRGGDTPVFSGGTASFQNLGLTTQVPAQYTVLSGAAPRTIRIGGVTARVRHRELGHLAGASQRDVWLLDAIRNLKHVPDSTPADALAKVMKQLKAGAQPVKKLLRFAQGEPPRVRALMGAMAEQIGYQGPELRKLRKSLNPLTKFYIGVGSVLPNAPAWNIV